MMVVGKTSKTVEAKRAAYKALMAFSGCDAVAFKRECEAVIHERADGEQPVFNSDTWLSAAAEAAWEQGTNFGKDKAAEAKLAALCAKVLG